MRRKDREITDIAAIDTFLTEEKILRIACVSPFMMTVIFILFP